MKIGFLCISLTKLEVADILFIPSSALLDATVKRILWLNEDSLYYYYTLLKILLSTATERERINTEPIPQRGAYVRTSEECV